MRLLRSLMTALLFVSMGAVAFAQQVPDTAFTPPIDTPEYAEGAGPTVASRPPRAAAAPAARRGHPPPLPRPPAARAAPAAGRGARAATSATPRPDRAIPRLLRTRRRVRTSGARRDGESRRREPGTRRARQAESTPVGEKREKRKKHASGQQQGASGGMGGNVNSPRVRNSPSRWARVGVNAAR